MRELGEKINRCNYSVPNVLSSVRNGPAVRQIAVGPAHVALLFDDGRVGRLAFSVISDRLDLSRSEASKSGPKAGTSSTSRQQARQRGRINRAATLRGGRGTGVIMGSARPVLPAQYVPEELISQAQVVLQGKSRSVIIRELQRTNLDVNLAVNNLLSRDDEEGEDADDSQDSYVSEDLMSLLDSGIGGATDPVMLSDAVDAVFPEDMFAYSTLRKYVILCLGGILNFIHLILIFYHFCLVVRVLDQFDQKGLLEKLEKGTVFPDGEIVSILVLDDGWKMRSVSRGITTPMIPTKEMALYERRNQEIVKIKPEVATVDPDKIPTAKVVQSGCQTK